MAAFDFSASKIKKEWRYTVKIYDESIQNELANPDLEKANWYKFII